MEWALRTIPFYQKQSGPSTTTFATHAQALDEWLRRIISICKSHGNRGAAAYDLSTRLLYDERHRGCPDDSPRSICEHLKEESNEMA